MSARSARERSTLTKSVKAICCLLALFLLTTAAPAPAAPGLPASAPSPPRERLQIVVLNSYQYGLPIPDSINRGLLTSLTEGGISVSDILVEHLNLDRPTESRQRAEMAALLRRRVAGRSIGLVIAEGPPAVAFLADEGKDLFPDCTTLTLIAPDLTPLNTGQRKLMDIPWRVDFPGTLRLALDLFPKTRRIFVVTGAKDGVLPFLEVARKGFAPWRGRLAIEFSNRMSYEEMLRRVATLPADAVIVYSPFFNDVTGRSFVPAEVAVKICQAASVPVFATLEQYLGLGIVGGSLLKTEDVGKQAGKAALDFLGGRLKPVKPVTTLDTVAALKVDWRELSRWKAEISRLPGESIVINRPTTLWEQQKGMVMAAAAVMATLALLVVALVLLNRRLRRMTVAANDSEARFRVMVDHAPEAVVVYDLDLKRNIEANFKAEQLFGCSREKLLQGGPDRFYAQLQPDGLPVAESFSDHAMRVLAGEEAIFERNVQADDGRELSCEVRLVQLPYREQRLMRASFIDISERKLAEEKLRAAKAFTESTLNSIPDFFYSFDLDGRLTSWNETLARISGYNEQELASMTVMDFFPKDDFQRIARAVEKIYSEGASKDEAYFLLKDGRIIPCEFAGSILRDCNDRIIGFTGIGRDISERKKIEKRSHRYSQHLHRTGKMARIGGWEVDLKSMHLFWSEQIYRILEVDPDRSVTVQEAIGFYAPESRPVIQEAVERLIEQGTSFDLELQVVTARNKHLWVRAQGESECRDGGPASIFGTFQDITERKRQDEVVRKSEQEFRQLAEAMPQIVWATRADGWNTYFNQQWVDYTGQTLEESYGHGWNKPFHPDDQQRAWDAWQNATNNGASYALECRLRRADGVYQWWLIRGVPVMDAGGAILKWFGTCTDIQEIKRSAQEKLALEQQLHQIQKMESVGSLAGGVAHDFNNKLSVILGHTYLALTETDPMQLHDSLEQIRKASEQSADLTRQLLAFARKQTIAPRMLDLNETVSSMLKMLQRLIGEDISLAWQPAAQLWRINADPSQIDQILANLCVNAKDSMAAGGKITIETANVVIDRQYCTQHAEVSPGEYVRLSVSDNGCGMDAETLPHIFEPFFTTKEVGQGTGLGLATIYGIVKQNNGFIGVYSEPGLGTTFSIHLLRHLGKPEQPRPAESALPVPGGLECVLLVEDESAILDMTAKILGKHGYRVLPANSPAEAIRLAGEHAAEISLLITDVIMPQMNGKELADRLRAIVPRLKCLFMSGYTADAIARHGVLEKGVHFIQKPFSLPDLANKVREVLDRAVG